jgi:hypothetical protein
MHPESALETCTTGLAVQLILDLAHQKKKAQHFCWAFSLL